MAKDSPKKERKGLETSDYYYTPQGFLVFTENYHLKRGYCCQNGCRHCPYGYSVKTSDILKSGGSAS